MSEDGGRSTHSSPPVSPDKLAARLTRSARVLDEAAERLLARAAEEAAAELDRLADTGAPWKHRLRAMDDAEERRMLLLALRRRQQHYVVNQIKSRSLTWGRRLTRRSNYGAGMDERVVELPLAVDALDPTRSGSALDAGAALNLAWLRRPGEWSVRILHVAQSGDAEEAFFDGDRVGYLFGDLRDLPLKDASFHRVLCVSTLEHVGMDNSRYGGGVERDPESALGAVGELRRVLAPGGLLFLTVPFGRPQDLGWFRVFGKREMTQVRGSLKGMELSLRWFQYAGSWFDEKPTRIAAADPADGAVRGLAVIAARNPG